MAKRIFVTATNTDIGKTYATKLLLKAYAKLGYRVGAFKPIETGVEVLPPDGSALLSLMHELNPDSRHLSVNDIVPIQMELPAAPYVANNAKSIDKNVLDNALKKLEACCDIVLIEGAGGLFVPIDSDTMMIDMISYFNAKALLVTHCRLGCINDTILSQKALLDADVTFEWALNCRDDDTTFSTVSEPYFKVKCPTLYYLKRDIDTLAKALIN